MRKLQTFVWKYRWFMSSMSTFVDFQYTAILDQVFSDFMPDPACLNQNLKDGATTAIEQLQEAESEAKALRSMTKRMILTQEEMVCP